MGQLLPNDCAETVIRFKRFAMNEVINISPHNFGKVDEMLVPFDVVFGQTVDVIGKTILRSI